MSRHFSRTLSVYVFIAFFFNFLCSFTEITVTVRQSLFVKELRQLFYGHLAIQSKIFPNCFKRPNDGSGTSVHKESTSRTNQGADTRLFTNYARNITKAKYKRNNSTRKIAKKLQHHNINLSRTNTGRKNGFSHIANVEQMHGKCYVCARLLRFAETQDHICYSFSTHGNARKCHICLKFAVVSKSMDNMVFFVTFGGIVNMMLKLKFCKYFS